MSRHGPFPIVHTATRTPWSAGRESLSSSASSQTYHVVPPSHHYVQIQQTEEGYWVPSQTSVALPPPGYLLAAAPAHNTLRPLQTNRSCQGSSGAATPQSSPTETVILPCGGHCVLLEAFCHRFLQVCFVSGMLSGVLLSCAGLMGGPELGVLGYIGCLTGLVSGTLLAIQSRSRPPRRRQRYQPPPLREEIPLREMRPPPSIIVPHTPSTIPPQTVFREESGIPWWRRDNIN